MMSIAEPPVRPARRQGFHSETIPTTEPGVEPDIVTPPEPGRVGEPGVDPETIPQPDEPEPEPAGVPGERMRGYVYEGYYYSE